MQYGISWDIDSPRVIGGMGNTLLLICLPLFVTASHRGFAGIHPHVAKRARAGKAGIVFPLKK
eukprot:9922467-Lingulodinium_polyedra.AAC.1